MFERQRIHPDQEAEMMISMMKVDGLFVTTWKTPFEYLFHLLIPYLHLSGIIKNLPDATNFLLNFIGTLMWPLEPFEPLEEYLLKTLYEYLLKTLNLYKKELEIQEELLGSLHPTTVRAREDVIIVLESLNRNDQALKHNQPITWG